MITHRCEGLIVGKRGEAKLGLKTRAFVCARARVIIGYFWAAAYCKFGRFDVLPKVDRFDPLLRFM